MTRRARIPSRRPGSLPPAVRVCVRAAPWLFLAAAVAAATPARAAKDDAPAGTVAGNVAGTAAGSAVAPQGPQGERTAPPRTRVSKKAIATQKSTMSQKTPTSQKTVTSQKATESQKTPTSQKTAASQKQAAAGKLRATERARAATVADQHDAAVAAAAAAAREAALAARRVEAAAQLRAIESRVAADARKVQQAAAQQKEAEDEVAQRSQDLNTLLPAALRLSLYPSETLLAAPGPPDKAVEGVLATQGVSAEVARQVAELRNRQQAARKLAADTQRHEADLADERARQGRAAAELDRQITAAAHAQTAALDESAYAAQAASVLAARADDLRSAIAAMDEAERQARVHAAEEARLAESQAHQQQAEAARIRQAALSRPVGPGLTIAAPKVTLVAGEITKGWGAPAEDGPASGITYSVAPAAYVGSPCTGRVAFAAPFRSYGKLMIIECGGGYDFVLAGMARLDATVGRPVRPGEPVGRMPDYDPAHATDKPALYVELRKNGQPINPLPYLNGKA